MGIGNGVFHPADFAILNANVAPRRLGHAYSAHGIGGNIGYMLAPVVSFTLGSAFGWRLALAAMGAVGFLAFAAVSSQRALLRSHRADDAHLHTLKGSFALFMQAPIVLCFALFRRADDGEHWAADVHAHGAPRGPRGSAGARRRRR